MKKCATLFICLILAVPLRAEDIPIINENGQVGGLHLPTARTLEPGTAYTGFGHSEFYEYGFIGFQPIEDLRLTLRNEKDRFGLTYTGLDAQLQLLGEGDWVPETALGFTHMVGDPIKAGEYVAMNKRFGDFDFGLGVGWGHYGENGAFENPFHLHNTFRDIGFGDDGPSAWFHGSRLGLFGGVTYQTPWHWLQLSAEYDRDPYLQERFEELFLGDIKTDRRAPVNVGAHVTLIKGLALSASMDGLSQYQLYITYALNFQKENPEIWQMGYEDRMRPAPIRDENAAPVDVKQIQSLAWRDGVALEKLQAPQQDILAAHYQAGDVQPYGSDIGHAAYAIADNTNADVVAISLVPEHDGLLGDTYTLLRRDIVRDTQFKGSATEIRQTASITPTVIDVMPSPTIPEHPTWRLFTAERFDIDPYEFSSFLLSRERLQLGGTYELLRGVSVGMTGDYRLGNNYNDVPPSTRPVRTNLNQYMGRDEAIENLYANAMQTIAPGLHTRVTAGLLEEMYRGASAEVLYQPFASRWAVGLEGDWLQQRSPTSDFGKLTYETTPWIASFYYEILPRDLTIIARVQQFLAEDKGFTLEFQHEFLRGAKINFGLDWSNQRDFGGLEDRGHLAARMALHIPLEYAFANVPIENRLDTYLWPVARDSGQQVEMPVRLWDATRPISYGPIMNSWDDFLNF